MVPTVQIDLRFVNNSRQKNQKDENNRGNNRENNRENNRLGKVSVWRDDSGKHGYEVERSGKTGC
jgi:hypothetical protein